MPNRGCWARRSSQRISADSTQRTVLGVLVLAQTMKYPDAPHADVIDILRGIRVPDPFRRLESADDPATAAWVAEQNTLTRSLLDSPLRDGLAARLRELHRVPRMSVAAVRGDRIFF